MNIERKLYQYGFKIHVILQSHGWCHIIDEWDDYTIIMITILTEKVVRASYSIHFYFSLYFPLILIE